MPVQGQAGNVLQAGEPHTLEDFRLTLESYLISPFNVTRLAAAAINKSEPVPGDSTRGVIIQTASIAGFEGQIGQMAFGSAKGGIISMTLIAARDLSPAGIRVVTIAPGMVNPPPTAGPPSSSRRTGARRSCIPSGWAKPTSTPSLHSPSRPTTT